MVESVQLTTIYLVDLVGSTHLASSVGPVRYDQLRDELFGLLREAIGATGCVVFRDCCTGLDRCLSIEDFRAQFWLVRTSSQAAA